MNAKETRSQLWQTRIHLDWNRILYRWEHAREAIII